MSRIQHTTIEHMEQMLIQRPDEPTILTRDNKLIVILEPLGKKFITVFSIVQLVMLKPRVPRLYKYVMAASTSGMLPLPKK